MTVASIALGENEMDQMASALRADEDLSTVLNWDMVETRTGATSTATVLGVTPSRLYSFNFASGDETSAPRLGGFVPIPLSRIEGVGVEEIRAPLETPKVRMTIIWRDSNVATFTSPETVPARGFAEELSRAVKVCRAARADDHNASTTTATDTTVPVG